ncbi:MAG: hypothetical protein GXP38_17620 [Chloroflexi bacterium]|nr:hypothetical protein [Chloroflexota bacterium]
MKLSKIAAILAVIIGAMAVFAGGQVVLLGKVQDYYVIDWLPIYNFIMGLLTVFLTALLIWKNSRYAFAAAIATFVLHGTVMVILQTAYRSVVAPDSIRAMTVRLVAWVIILALLFIERVKNRREEHIISAIP